MSDLQARLQNALGSTYAIERELGGGGMSRVFLAKETALGRAVVIKVLPPELEGAVSAERFRREIALAARLQHPTIVPLLAAGEADGLLYYTMPFIDGTTLRAEIASAGALPVARVMGILRDVLEALSYAHAQGVIHRDIKPDNVLLAPHHAVVSDFGVAKALAAAGTGTGSGTGTGIVIGSPSYMAPEQAAADPSTDHRADLYAVGVVGYEMLAGAPPFAGRPPSQMLAAHIAEKPEPVASKRSGIPPALSALIMRLLEKDPRNRPQSAEEALGALERGGVGPRPSALSRTAAIGIALVLVAGAGIAIAIAMRGEPKAGGRAPAGQGPSIAVLRFEDLSESHANAYLSDGITDELIGALSRVPGLRVVGRASSFRFRSDSLTPQEIGKRLNVGAVVEGSVQREGDALRVRAQLHDTSTNVVLWEEKYDRKMSNVFRIEDEVSSAIASKLSARFASRDTVASTASPTDIEAYQLYLQGRYFWNKRTGESLRKSIELFGRAIAIDPTYARAYAGLADAYNVLGGLTFEAPIIALPKAKVAALKALALDSNLAEAHAALGFAQIFYDWDWPGARANLERAIALDPNYPIAHLYYGYYLQTTGQGQHAVEELRRAVALDPFSLILNVRLGGALIGIHAYDSAIAVYRHVQELDSTFVLIGSGIAEAYIGLGQYDKALHELKRLDTPGDPYLGGKLVYALARSGRRDSALVILAKMRAHVPASEYPAYHRAIAFAGLGERDSVFLWLSRMLDERGATIIFLADDPTLEELRSDPRFAALERRAGLLPPQPR